jgi:carbon monoxide dehydrogenase subunit G
MLLWLSLVTASLAGLSDAELATAMNGKPAVRAEAFMSAAGKDAGRGVGAIVIDRPLADVWATLTRYDDRTEYMPRIKKVTVYEQTPYSVHVKQEVDASVTTSRYTAFVGLDTTHHVIHWQLDRGATDNTLADVDGDYHLFEVTPQRTLVVYRSYVDTGLKVPKSIQLYIARKSIPDLMTSIKSRIESGGTWKRK